MSQTKPFDPEELAKAPPPTITPCPIPERVVDIHYQDMPPQVPEHIRQSFEAAVNEAAKRVMTQRNEILEAFVAKYGFADIERAVQVEERLPDGTWRWFVRRRTDEEMARDNALHI